MYSYLNFFNRSSGPSTSEKPEARARAGGEASEQDEDEEDSQKRAPMFPAPDSIQRSTTQSQPVLKIDSVESDEEIDQDLYDFDLDSLPPPTTTRIKPPKARKKVVLMPGFSQLDWAKLKSSGKNLRGEGVNGLRRITRSELAEHRTKEDAWSSFNGKVYNLTPYLNYHPGGVRELMRVAGKDGTELFMKTHAWISVDAMMDSCLLGFLVND